MRTKNEYPDGEMLAATIPFPSDIPTNTPIATTQMISDMQAKIEAVVYEYADQVPVAIAIGVLEVVKFQIHEAQNDE